MRSSLLLLTLWVAFTTHAQKRKPTLSSTDRFAGLDTTFARVLKDWKVAGFAVAVVEKGKVVYAKGFGYRDLENKLPVTANTLFAIGSCTKAFTSSLVGLLQKDGKIEYDEPVRKYLPDLKFYNDELNNQITLRDMMCHRTGLPRHDFSWYLSNTTRDSLLNRIRYLEPSAPLRQTWQYNNFMFLAQGVLAEKLFGKPWETNVEEKIFKPLGMKNSVFTMGEMEKSADASKGYEVEKDSLIKKMDYYNIDGMGPAGSINSSVNDMSNWLITWINGGKFEGKEILPASYVTQAMSSQMIIGAGLPTKEIPDVHLSNYGFGWFLASYKGHYRVEHGGNIDGFSASTCFFPSDSVGIVVLSNQNGSAVPGIVRNFLADRMLGLKYFDWSQDRLKAVNKAKADAKKGETTASSNRKKGTKLSHSVADYAGIYANDGYGKYVISAKGDSLFIQTKAQKWWLRQYHYDIFEPFDVKDNVDTSDSSPIRVQFTTGLMGDIESVAMTGFGVPKPVVFTRSAPPKAVTADELKKYVGEYELMGQTIKIYTKNDKTLFAFVPGQPEYELVFLGKDKFNIKVLKDFSLQFEINAQGETTGTTFMQPNGNFKATKKK